MRYYSSTAGEMTLQAAIGASDTSLTVDTTAGLPTSYPYTLLLDYGRSAEEIVDVTAAAGTVLTITRGVDGTTGQAHDLGAKIRHGYTARDARESRGHEAASTDVHGVAGSVVGTTDTQTLDNKTIRPSAGDHAALNLQEVVGGSATEPVVDILDQSGNRVGTIDTFESTGVNGADNYYRLRRGTGITFWGNILELALRGAVTAITGTKASGATGKFLRLLATDGSTETFSVDADGNLSAANVDTAAWTSYTPPLSGFTLGGGTMAAYYTKVGKTVHARVAITMGSTSTFSGTLGVGMPIAFATGYSETPVGTAYLRDSSAGYGSRTPATVFAGGSATVNFITASASPLVTSTVPWAWAAGDALNFSVAYESA